MKYSMWGKLALIAVGWGLGAATFWFLGGARPFFPWFWGNLIGLVIYLSGWYLWLTRKEKMKKINDGIMFPKEVSFNLVKRGCDWALYTQLDASPQWVVKAWETEPKDAIIKDVIEIVSRAFEIYGSEVNQNCSRDYRSIYVVANTRED